MTHLIGHLFFDLGKGMYARINSCNTTNTIDVGGINEITEKVVS